jgi:hypothetical protein
MGAHEVVPERYADGAGKGGDLVLSCSWYPCQLAHNPAHLPIEAVAPRPIGMATHILRNKSAFVTY